MTKRGPDPDVRRIFAAMIAIEVFKAGAARLPRASDLAPVITRTWPESGKWDVMRVHRALNEAAAAGLVTRHAVTPSLYEWDTTMNINVSNLVRYLIEKSPQK